MRAPLFQPSDVPITVVTPGTRTPFARYSIVGILTSPHSHGVVSPAPRSDDSKKRAGGVRDKFACDCPADIVPMVRRIFAAFPMPVLPETADDARRCSSYARPSGDALCLEGDRLGRDRLDERCNWGMHRQHPVTR